MTPHDSTTADFEVRMRQIEDRHERHVAPEAYLVARLDGRAFHTLTKDLGVEKPFDAGFRDAMINAAKHVMQSGFNTAYAFVQSDEISVLFDALDATFGRRYSKLISVLAGEASAALSLGLGASATFDCRLLELGDQKEIHEYFTWRQRDAERNCLNTHAYWTLRNEGLGARAATRELSRLSRDQKKTLLLETSSLEYGSLPVWQRRGIGLYYEYYEKVGTNPLTGRQATAQRRRIKVDLDIPWGEEHNRVIDELMGA